MRNPQWRDNTTPSDHEYMEIDVIERLGPNAGFALEMNTAYAIPVAIAAPT